MLIVGQERIADVFGVAPKTIVEWQEQGLPIALRGSPGIPSEYESQACINWLCDREIRKLQLESANDRLARVRADSIDMDNAERRKVLVPAADLEPRLRAAMVGAREAWLDAAPRLARDVQGKPAQAVEDLLMAEFEAFLHRIAQWGQATDDEDEEGDDK